MSHQKPKNYFDELTSGQQEKRKWLDDLAAKTERYRKIVDAQRLFNTVGTAEEAAEDWHKKSCLVPARPTPKVNPMPPRLRTRRIGVGEEEAPLFEEVMLARGILHVTRQNKGILNG
jgi:hypothetical protein